MTDRIVDPDNLYFVAMGDRSDYGATDGAKYTWTRTLINNPDTGNTISDTGGQFVDDVTGDAVRLLLTDMDIGEIEECVSTLEAAQKIVPDCV